MKWSCLAALLLLAVDSQMCFAQTLSVRGTQLVDDKGKVVRLRGINWFGFNNKQTMLDGLWAGDGSITVDFFHILYRIKLLGFNAVRVPFSFQDLKLSPRQFNRFCQVQTKADILALTRPAGVTPARQPSANPATISGNTCNAGLPTGSTYERFKWVLRQFAQEGLYIVPDNHVRIDEDMTAHNDPRGWVRQWELLVADLVKEGVIRRRLIVDLLNEPDVTGFVWQDTKRNGKTKRGLTWLMLSAMDAIHKVSPSTLLVVAGTGGDKTMTGGNPAVPYWGGFVTNSTLVKSAGLSDATPFFRALMSKPYLQKVVLTFHAYSSTVIPFQVPADQWAGKGLTRRYTRVFGYLTGRGFCHRGKCHKFPFIIGEFSAPKQGNARDVQETTSFANYFNNKGDGNDGKHAKIENWMFWCWNQNSGDTGGIVKEGWRDIDWNKVSFLEQHYSLKPWYR